MHRLPLQFSHANGFPAGSYRTLLEALGRDCRVHALEAIGTDPRYPVTDGWPHLVEQLLDTVARRREPVVAVGHSLGGFLSFMAAVERPALFRCVVMLDSPVIGPVKARLFEASKRFGIVDRITPAGAVRARRAEWPDRETARAHFATRRLFRDFAPDCLDDYVNAGLVEADGGLRLRIPPETEYRIYRGTPHDLHRRLDRLRVPVGFIGGAESDVVERVGLRIMRGRFRLKRIPGGHLFPLEHPAASAAAILEMIRELI